MHALQAEPLMGWDVSRSGMRHGRTAVWLLAGACAAFIVYTFVQALRGRPSL